MADSSPRDDIAKSSLALAFDFGRRGWVSLFVCVFAMALAAACTLKHWRVSQAGSENFRNAVTGLLETKFEPRASVQRAAVTTIAIELEYLSEARCVNDTGPVCGDMRRMLNEYTQRITRLADELTTEPSVFPPSLTFCELRTTSSPGERWLHVEQMRSGPGICAGGERAKSLLRLSPFLFDCASKPSRVQDAWACLGPRGRRAVQATDGLDQDLETWVAARAAGPVTEHAAVQVFFLSPEGVLRVWRADTSPVALLNDLRGRDYVTGSRQTEDAFETDLYLDLGGNGFVRSYCQRVRSDKLGNLGVLCIDYNPAETTPLSNQDVVRHSRVDLFVDGSDRAVQATGLSASDLNTVRQRLADEDATNLVHVMDVHGTDPKIFLVPISKREGRISYVLVRTAELDLPNSFWFMLASLAIALGLMVTAVAVRRREFNVEDEYAILRKLQVGLLRADANGLILEGNDRAEEMLGVEFPPLGIGKHGRGYERWRFGRLFNTSKVTLVKFDGPDEAPKAGEKPKLRATKLDGRFDIEKIDAARSAGSWSRYYIRKADPNRGSPGTPWLSVVGSPMLIGDGDAVETFALLSIPSEKRRDQLEPTKPESAK